MAYAGMNDLAGKFIDDQQIIVFVYLFYLYVRRKDLNCFAIRFIRKADLITRIELL